MFERKVSREEFFDELNNKAHAVYRGLEGRFHKKYKIREIILRINDIKSSNLNIELVLVNQVIEIVLDKDLSWFEIHLANGGKFSFRCETGNIMADSEEKMIIHSAETRSIVLKIYRNR